MTNQHYILSQTSYLNAFFQRENIFEQSLKQLGLSQAIITVSIQQQRSTWQDFRVDKNTWKPQKMHNSVGKYYQPQISDVHHRDL